MHFESWVYNQNIRAPGCLLLADANEQRQELNLKTVLHSESQKSEKTLDQHLKNLSSSSSLSDVARNGGRAVSQLYLSGTLSPWLEAWQVWRLIFVLLV